ncbi:MAG: hypothetical protein ACI4DY_05690 [Monoglobaceae bacterium]
MIAYERINKNSCGGYKMQKDFLEELIEELNALKDSKQFPTLPTPKDVFACIANVAKRHNITANEMRAILAMRAVSRDELETLKHLQEED